MMIIITVLSISAILTVLFILLTVKYKDYINKVVLKRDEAEKEKSLDELLDRYVIEEEKDVMKEKLAKISEIIKSTQIEIEKEVEQKVEVAEAQLKAKGKEELEILTKAQTEFLSFTANFRSAIPETEEERQEDMTNLQEAISMLESFDAEAYNRGQLKVDAGLGMFYEKMSRRFKSIMEEHKMDEDKFIPIQKLKYYAFQEIRNLKNSDILPIINIMKDTGLLNDLIEVNSTLQLIVLSDKKYKFTNPEKVLITFAFDEPYLTLQRLMKITEWKEPYAGKIISGFVKKGVATFLDDNIKIDGFGHAEERKKWNETINDFIKKEKEKEEEKRRRQDERKKQLKEQLSRVEKAEIKEVIVSKVEEKVPTEDIIDSLDAISPVDKESSKMKFDKKPDVKALPTPKKEPVKTEVKPKAQPTPSVKKEPVKKEQEDLSGTIDALDAFLTEDDTKEIKKKEAEAKLDFDFDLQESSEEERDLEDLIPEKILAFHEKFSVVNGGLAQYEKIKEYIEKELRQEVPEDLFKAMLEQLKELQMIQSSTKIGKHDFYLFTEIKLGIHEKNFLRVCIDRPPCKKEDVMETLHWEAERTLKMMKDLQEKGLIQLEKELIIIPGAIQK